MTRPPRENERVWVVWYGRQVFGQVEDAESLDDGVKAADDPDARYIIEFDKPEPCECGCGTDTPEEVFPLRWLHELSETATPEQLTTEGYGGQGWERRLVFSIDFGKAKE